MRPRPEDAHTMARTAPTEAPATRRRPPEGRRARNARAGYARGRPPEATPERVPERRPLAQPPPTRADRRAQLDERRRRRRRNRLVLLVIALILLPFVVAGIWFYLQLSPTGSPGAPVTIEVRKGWGRGEVGDALAAKDVIGSKLAFSIWTTVTGSKDFTPGVYRMRKNLGVRDAVRILDDGPKVATANDRKLLLPPGLTLGQIADRVAKVPGHDRDKFLGVVNSGAIRSKYEPPEVTSLEGLLFPDTYFVSESESDDSIVKRLVARFDQIGDGIGLGTPANGLTPYQTVIVASLIEREAKVADDAPLIAEVVINRLKAGMPLQIDATLCYAKGGCTAAPTNADKQIDSPYNTYKNMGLIPTPISSVTRASLEAALHPARGNFLYYVIKDRDGHHAFAATLEEHNRNVAEARKKGLL